MSFRLPTAVTTPALLVVLAFSGWSQQPPVPRGRKPDNPNSTPTGPPPKPGTVEGSVTSSLSHAPIRQATVSINGPQGTYVGQTDDGGKFHISNVSPGTYFIGETRAQSFRYRPPGRMSSGQIIVSEAQDVTGIKVEMEPLGVISGKVVDDDGEPVRDAQVTALASDYTRGTRMLNTRGYSRTDDRGEFRLFDLNPGRYLVRAWLRPDFSPPQPLANVHRSAPEMGYAATYYPQGSDPTQAVASEVGPGAEVTGVDIRLHSVPVYHIRGKLRQEGGTGPPGSVTAAPCGGAIPLANSGDQLFGQANQTGAFDISGVTSGTWCVTVQRGGPNARIYGTATANITDHSVEGLVVDIATMTAVPGVVIVDGQSTQEPNFNVALQRTGTFQQNGNAQVKDRAFSIANVVPETYQVMARGLMQGWYLKAMQYGSQDVSDGLVTLRNDGTTLTLVVGTDGGQVSGAVQTDGGDPALNARIIVVPDDRFANRRDLLKFTGVDTSGHFLVTGLAPGEYKVYACEDDDLNLWYAVDFRKELSNRAASITITAGGSSTAQVKTIPADELAKVKAKFQ